MRGSSRANEVRSDNRMRRAAVEALETRRLLTVFTVVNFFDTGPGSLRDAIMQSNLDTAGPNEIDFSIGGAGVQTITLKTNLPQITQAVTINGYSQPLATPNTLAVGDNANVLIHVTGDSKGDISILLDLNAGHCVVEGLSLDNATTALVNIEGNQNFTTIKGNLLGTDTTDGPQPNEDDIDVSGADCLVGGTDPGSRNIVSGAGNFGINVQLGQDTVAGNYIGTDSTGTAALPNSNGISVQDGVDVISHNVISGNTQSGLVISEETGPSVINNLIGTDATGAGPLGNQYGVYVNAFGDFAIGGNSPAQGNVIAYNSLVGVELQPPINGAISPVGVTIRYNSIYGNGDSGINDGGAANDYQDGDSGANNQQNFPILASAVSNGTTTTIQAGLNSTPAQLFLLDFYSNPDTQADGFVQGKTYLGTSLVQTDGDGNALITATFNVAVPAGQYITATASDTAGAPYDNTSPFGQGVMVASSATGTPPPATDQPLNAIGAPSVSATEGASFNGVLAKFSDPDAGALPADFTATIIWGDTTSSAGSISKDPSGGFDVSGTHTYAEEGTYGVSVMITDTTGRNDTGGQTATATTSAIVADANVVATGGESLFATEGAAEPAQVLATFTDPGGNEPLADYSATINWGDGNSSAGVILSNNGSFEVAGSHTYAEEMNGTVTVTISHDTSTPQTVTDSITVADANLIVTGNYSVSAVEGAASASQTVATFTDPGGAEPLADYSATIDWGDGSPLSAGVITYAAGIFTVSGSHTYAEESSTPYTLTTKISHDTSSTLTAFSTATVADANVIATGNKSITATEGAASASQTVATFTDPGGAEALADYSASITWGDGSSASAGTITFANGIFSVAGSHRYTEETAANTPYVVTVTVSHDTSTPQVVTSSATVIDPSVVPNTAGNVLTITEGQNTGAVTLASFVDPGGAEALGDYSAKINWGDGSAQTAGTISVNNGKFTVTSAGHTYAEEGIYSPVITISHDTSKSVSVTDAHRITVKDAPLTGQAGAPLSGNEGRTVSGTVATFSDAYVTAPISDYSAIINFGDGTTGSGVIHSMGGGKYFVTVAHAFAEESTGNGYVVAVTIKDIGGSSLIFNTLAKIAPSPLDTPVGQSFNQGVNTTFTNKLLGSFRDQDALNTMPEDYNITINWGDGTTSPGMAVLTGATANVGSYWNVLGTHKYSTTGTKNVKITVYDDATTGTALVIATTIKVV